MSRYFLPFCVILAFVNTALWAQGTKADYDRAASYTEKIRDKVYHSPGSFTWIAGQPRFWYSKLTPSGLQFIVVDAEKGSKAPAFDHKRLALSLSASSGQEVSADSFPFRRITLTEDNHVEVQAFGK